MLVSAPRYAHPLRTWLKWPRVTLTAPLALSGALLCYHLWGEWKTNPDLSHGFFAPVIFGLLLWEGLRTGSQRWLTSGWVQGGLVALATAMALGMFILSGLLAASIGWSHSAVSFSLAAAFVFGCAGALLILSDDRVRAIPFNWTVLTAIGLWLLAAPLPSGTYARLTFSLQSGVTSWVLAALHILGVPARQIGNVIELANTSVGVEEACSGIRSLISCTYAGFFFAAWLVQSPARRAVLIIVAPLLAVLMNFLRSLGLTLLANRGIDIAGTWHDVTGYAILALTAVALAGLAALLSPAKSPVPHPVATDQPRVGRWPMLIFLAGGSLVAVFAAIFTVFAARAPQAEAPHELTSIPTLFPAPPPGWQVNDRNDLQRFSGILQTERLAERTYLHVAEGKAALQINIYVAHWRPGEASVSMVASHTPDACWPGSGWEQLPNTETRVGLLLPGLKLPPAEQRIFHFGSVPQHVWFWHLYAGRPTDYLDPRSIPALVRLSLKYGFRREGEQYFIRFSSNQPWSVASREPFVQELFANLARIGLTQ